MGRKVSDGKAFNLTVPDASAVVDNELYRIGGVNGLSMGDVPLLSADATAPRTIAFEADPAAVYSIHIPSALNPNPGDFLFWNDPSSGTGFQYGLTDLKASPQGTSHLDGPCFWVVSARSADTASGYVIRGRILNGVPGSGTFAWT